MLNNSEREEIKAWLNSKRDYDQGLLLLSKHTKNRILLRKRNIPIEKIVFELNKYVVNDVILGPVIKQVLVSPQTKKENQQPKQSTQVEIKKKRILQFVKNQLQQLSIKFKS